MDMDLGGVRLLTICQFERGLPRQSNDGGMPLINADSTALETRVNQFFPQHFLYFLPLPHGHGSLRPTFGGAM